MAKKVLVVDDSAIVRNIHSFMLKSAGFEVTEASNGYEAMEKLLPTQFDLVVTDINMPNGMGGIEFIKKIQQQQLTTPIIAMSGYLKNSEAIKALPKEVPLMEKPVNLRILVQKIN